MNLLKTNTPKGLELYAELQLREDINRILMQSDSSPRDRVMVLIDYALSTSILYKEEHSSWTELREQLVKAVGERFDLMVVKRESWRAAA